LVQSSFQEVVTAIGQAFLSVDRFSSIFIVSIGSGRPC